MLTTQKSGTTFSSFDALIASIGGGITSLATAVGDAKAVLNPPVATVAAIPNNTQNLANQRLNMSMNTAGMQAKDFIFPIGLAVLVFVGVKYGLPALKGGK